jgi:hypothetical protein
MTIMFVYGKNHISLSTYSAIKEMSKRLSGEKNGHSIYIYIHTFMRMSR